MSSEDQYQQELQQEELRRDGSQYVVSILGHSESKEYNGRWRKEVPNLPILSRGVGAGAGGAANYGYGVVMHAGDRNLQAIFNYEYPGVDAIKLMARQVLEALQYIHSKKVMHGDVKMLNVTRFNHDNRLRLIDFDASCPVDVDSSYAGAKFSSSCEMIYRLETAAEIERVETYWQRSGIIYDNDESKLAWFDKIAMRTYKNYSYCIKTFNIQKSDDQSLLPYSLTHASASIDIWSVGIMLYQLATGQSLVKIDRNDDIVSGEGYHTIYTWDDGICELRLKDVNDLTLRDLLSCMLRRDPEKRLSCSDLLNRPFFIGTEPTTTTTVTGTGPAVSTQQNQAANEKLLALMQDVVASQTRIEERLERIDAKLVVIEGLSRQVRYELCQGFDTMKLYIKATVEVTVPTLFIITPARDKTFYAKLKAEALSGGKSLSTKSKEFFKQASQFYDSVTNFDFSPTKSFMSLLNDNYEMHLLCELCYEKVETPGVWPVPIENRKESLRRTLHSLLPLARVGLGVAKIVNGAAGVARIMGYPVPNFQLDGIDLSLFKNDSSLQDYSGLEQTLFDAAKRAGDVGSNEKLEGYSQRELKRFLSETDPNDDWGKLKRILLDEGCAMWCCPRCCQILKDNPKVSYKDLRATVGNPSLPSTAALETPVSPSYGNPYSPSLQQPQSPNFQQSQPINQYTTPTTSPLSSTPMSSTLTIEQDLAHVKHMLSTLITDKLINKEQRIEVSNTLLSNLSRVAENRANRANHDHYNRAISASMSEGGGGGGGGGSGGTNTSPRYDDSTADNDRQCQLS